MSSRWRGLALIGAWSTLAAQPSADTDLAALTRDLDRYAECLRELDIACQTSLTHQELAQELPQRPRSASELREAASTPPESNPLTSLARYTFETPAPPFHAGSRLYSLIPYESEGPVSLGWSQISSFLVGISDDEGASWRFIDGRLVASARIDRIIPDFDREDLPGTEGRVIPTPSATRSDFLQTDRGGFYSDGEAAAYTLVVDTRKRVNSEIVVTVRLDDPLNPGLQREYQSSLSPGQLTLEIVSPVMSGFEGGKVYNVVLTGSDAATGEAMFEHRQPLLFGAGGPVTVISSSR